MGVRGKGEKRKERERFVISHSLTPEFLQEIIH
jgi:hypothetical protein